MKRLVALLTALVTVAAAPAAHAQSYDEASCRATGASRAFCVGVGKLGERASAECRRLGVLDDATCWSRVGRRVVRAEIDAYENSWTHRALAFQSRLGDALPFRDAPWVGTHNSYNSSSETPTLSHTDSNQQLSLTDQLRLDVRSLELDVHWLPSPYYSGSFAPVVCHGQGNAGCTTERLLAEHLAHLRAWLDEHPREVLLLYLEDGIDDPAGYEAAAATVSETFGSRLYRPRGEGCQNLPLDLTRRAIRKAGAQVIVVSNCGQGSWSSVAHAWPGEVRFEDRPRGYQAFPACGAPAPAESAAKLVRYYEDSTFVAPAAERTGFSSTDDGLTPATTRELVRCGVDLLGFDQLLPTDGRLDAAVWSWAEDQPAAPGCTVQRDDERWESRSCRERHAAACRAPDGTFSVVGGELTAAQARRACARRGLKAALPRTGNENARLRAAAPAGVALWLAHRTR